MILLLPRCSVIMKRAIPILLQLIRGRENLFFIRRRLLLVIIFYLLKTIKNIWNKLFPGLILKHARFTGIIITGPGEVLKMGFLYLGFLANIRHCSMRCCLYLPGC